MPLHFQKRGTNEFVPPTFGQIKCSNSGADLGGMGGGSPPPNRVSEKNIFFCFKNTKTGPKRRELLLDTELIDYIYRYKLGVLIKLTINKHICSALGVLLLLPSFIKINRPVIF